jgi:hypothetical protein
MLSHNLQVVNNEYQATYCHQQDKSKSNKEVNEEYAPKGKQPPKSRNNL